MTADVRADLTALINDIDPNDCMHYGALADSIAVLFLLPRGLVDRGEQERSTITFIGERIRDGVRGADLADAVVDYLDGRAAR